MNILFWCGSWPLFVTVGGDILGAGVRQKFILVYFTLKSGILISLHVINCSSKCDEILVAIIPVNFYIQLIKRLSFIIFGSLVSCNVRNTYIIVVVSISAICLGTSSSFSSLPHELQRPHSAHCDIASLATVRLHETKELAAFHLSLSAIYVPAVPAPWYKLWTRGFFSGFALYIDCLLKCSIGLLLVGCGS